MANAHRGEIDADLNGQTYRLCLTLGALAELEQVFGETDLVALANRFETGRIAAREVTAIVAAGLRGAGYDLTNADVASMRTPRGAAGFVDIVARLLAATFGAPDAAVVEPATGEGAKRDSVPFPGTR